MILVVDSAARLPMLGSLGQSRSGKDARAKTLGIPEVLQKSITAESKAVVERIRTRKSA
jgi:hypothetical protein